MSYWVRVLKFKDLHVSHQLHDARDAMLGGLRELGYEASLEGGDTQIVMAGQLATATSGIPDGSIVWNLEQAGNFHFSPEYQTLMRRCRVWDYNHLNMKRLKKLYGVDSEYVPMGYVPVHERHNKGWNFEYDVMFIGSLFAHRRETIIGRLRAAGLNVFASNSCYGEYRDEILHKSRVFLNMHFHDEMIMESLRLAIGMANKKPCVCEVNPETGVDADLLPGVLEADYDGLVDACLLLARNPDVAAKFGERAYETFTARPMREVLRRVL